MSHAYPLAASARDALTAPDPAARTRAEARSLAKGKTLRALASDWLTLSGAEAARLEADIARGVDQGFVQRYEDAKGNTVLAITFWQITAEADPPAPDTKTQDPSSEHDHADDLYFRRGRTKRRSRRPFVDPNQLDLFSGPDQAGYERPDPDNPGVILTDEEGDGTSFGG